MSWGSARSVDGHVGMVRQWSGVWGLFCKVSSAWTDQMSLSDSVATTTENANRLGYKHVCINYLHMASHDYQYQEVIQHTHTHTFTHRIILFFLSLNSHLSFNMNSSGEWKFQILLNQKHKLQAHHKQTKEGVGRHKGLKSQYSSVNFIWLSHSLRM